VIYSLKIIIRLIKLNQRTLSLLDCQVVHLIGLGRKWLIIHSLDRNLRIYFLLPVTYYFLVVQAGCFRILLRGLVSADCEPLQCLITVVDIVPVISAQNPSNGLG
jgi:hypothetical protein